MSPVILLPADGPIPFDPSSVAGLFYWFDFSDTSTLFQDITGTTPVTANGQPLGRVNCKPGAAPRYATSSVNTPFPTWNSAGQNGLGTVVIDHVGAGGNGVLRDPSATLKSSPFTMFIAGTTPSQTTRSYVTDQFGCGGNRAVYFVQSNNPVSVYNGTTLPSGLPFNTFLTVTIEWNVSTRVWNQTTSTAFGNAGTLGQSAFQLGLICNDSPNTGAPLIIGEYLQYDGALAPADVTNIQNYLISKWGA